MSEKPSFRESVKNRCLVIADGFYEWQWLDAKGKEKQKYLITLPGEELFSFGGLWSEWINGQAVMDFAHPEVGLVVKAIF